MRVALERALTRVGQWQSRIDPEAELVGCMFTIMKNAWIDKLRSRARRSHEQLPATDTTGYRQAASALPPALRTALDAQAEAALVERRWSPAR